MRLIAALLAIASLPGCAITDFFAREADAAKALLVMRSTYAEPARQAGVLELAQAQAQRLDEAIASGDVDQVTVVLKSMAPVYREIYERIDSPTPAQVAFHNRALVLWEYLDESDSQRRRRFALLLIGEIFERVL